ncbi:MAG: thiamine pyrophosphate-binding protein, partial [Chloroflexi bacterium]|nr:thiamine pyrophosphate-binding protein [Chloroflexota bacterium]
AARSRIDRRRGHLADLQERLRTRQRSYIESQWDHPQIAEARLSSELWEVVRNEDFLYTSPRFRTMAPGIGEIPDSERCLGGGGGGAVGTGPGFFTGVSLAMKDSGKLLVSMTGDGEYVSGCQALWTAAHYHLPGLWVINNNRSYYNDEDHQDNIAKIRERPPENKWIAMRMERPEIDLAGLARSFGATGFGPVKEAGDLTPTFAKAVDAAKSGEMVVVDVWTENRTRGMM